MRILVAEDDPTTRLVLCAALERLGHEVDVADNGREAWESFRRDPSPIVITDWMMPDFDGLRLTRAIRDDPRGALTYILILTALRGKGSFLKGMDAGADDYVNKPFDPEELAARLRVAERFLALRCEVEALRALRSSERSASPALHPAD